MATTTYTGTLTPHHHAIIQSHLTRRMTAAMSTTPCDRAAGTAAVKHLYAAYELLEPEVLWVRSPLTSAPTGQQLTRNGLWADGVVDTWHQLRNHLGDQLDRQLEHQLKDQWQEKFGTILHELQFKLWDQFEEQLKIGGKLYDVRWMLGHPPVEQPINTWGHAYWITTRQIALEIAGLPSSPRLDALAAVLDHTMMIYPDEGAVTIVDRPIIIHGETSGSIWQLHADSGPALAWADGYEIHSRHGTRFVPPTPSGVWCVVAGTDSGPRIDSVYPDEISALRAALAHCDPYASVRLVPYGESC